MSAYGHVVIGGRRYPNSWVPAARVVRVVMCKICGDTGKRGDQFCGCATGRYARHQALHPETDVA